VLARSRQAPAAPSDESQKLAAVVGALLLGHERSHRRADQLTAPSGQSTASAGGPLRQRVVVGRRRRRARGRSPTRSASVSAPASSRAVVSASADDCAVALVLGSGETWLMSPRTAQPQEVAVALAEAMNAHDIDAFVSLIAPDYDSQQPAHPERAFVGRDQVRANWSAVFGGVADFRADLVATTVEGDTLCSEWRWRGRHDDGTRLDMAGVIVCGIRDGMLAWARLYMEPVESGGGGIGAVVRQMSGRD
jgi:ketosteroid isomerase-like protein